MVWCQKKKKSLPEKCYTNESFTLSIHDAAQDTREKCDVLETLRKRKQTLKKKIEHYEMAEMAYDWQHPEYNN